MAGDQSCAAQPIKAFGVGAWLAVEDPAHDISQFSVADQQDQDAPKVIPIERLITGGLLLESIE